jgi:integrase
VPGLASTQSLKDAIAEWLGSLKSTLDRRTVREYEIYAGAHWLTRWKTLGEINERAIGDYQRARLAKVTRVTLRKELSAMRGFLRWCVEQGAIAELPLVPMLPRQAIGKRAVPVRKRIILTPKEVERLVACLRDVRTRNYVEFAWETGLRPATIFRLAYPLHWSPGRSTLLLTDDVDKARFARELPLSKRAKEILGLSPLGRSGRFFVDRGGIIEELKFASIKCLKRRVSLYDFRHSRITLLVEAGGPLTGVQYLAGHKHLSTTAKYAHAGLRSAQEALDALTVGPGPRKRPKRAS